MTGREDRIRRLLDKLSTLKVEGASFGGPHVGVSHNDVTRAIVGEGDAIVPALVERLTTSGLDGTIFIVFCLRELRAKGAREAVEQLRGTDRFKNVEKDLTLDMQIKYYLRDVDSW